MESTNPNEGQDVVIEEEVEKTETSTTTTTEPVAPEQGDQEPQDDARTPDE